VAIAAAPYLYRRVDEEIRRSIQARFAKHYPNLKVVVGSAELISGQGIKVRDLSVLEPAAEGPRAELLSVEEMFLACQTDLKELICHDPVVTHVTLRRPTFRVTHRLDGTWSAAKLFPPPRFGDQSPEVTIENGSIEVFDPIKPRAGTLVLRDLNMTISPAALAASDPDAAGLRNVQGIVSGDNLRHVEFHGSFDASKAAFSLSGEIEGLQLSPELYDCLPAPLTDKCANLRALRAEGQVNFSLAYDSRTGAPPRFQLAGQLTGGRIDEQALPLPHPLTDIQIKFTADNGGIVVDRLSARCNQATIRMSLRHAGFDANSPLWLQAEIKQLELDRQLLGVLPETLQDQWQKYRPIGVVDADLTLQFDGRALRPESSEAAISFSNMSFTHHKFPYRVDHGKGSLQLKNDLLTLSVVAYCGSQPVRMKAEVSRPLHGPSGWFEAKGDDIQIDNEIIKALPEKSREVALSLNPRGTVNFDYSCRRDAPDQPLHHHLRLDANGCSIRYAKFPYPISNIRGQLEMIDQSWWFRNLQGVNDSAQIFGTGDLTPSLQGNKFILNIAAKNVPLDKELHDALAPNIQQAWDDLKPQGMVDLTAQICYLAEQKQLSLAVCAEPKSETASIEPVHFPYLMNRLQGTLTYRDGRVTWQQFKAEHGTVAIRSEGYCDFFPDGGWTIHLAGLTVDRLQPDRDLLVALPERLKKAILTLNPTGRPIDLRGNLDFLHDGRPGTPLRCQWDDVRINLFQTSLQCGIRLDNVFGTVTLAGQSDGQTSYCRGELNLESLNYRDWQFKNVMGPISIDDQRILLGSLVDKSADGSPMLNPDGTTRSPRSISANLFGGTVYGDGQVSLGAEPRYHFAATLAHADLARMAREVMDPRQHLQGKIMANIELHGTGASRNAMSGRGSLAISDADVYELPVMISLLKILSIRAPDRNAFSTADMDYRIEGEHMYLDRIDFNGDAISLRGKGEMDFQSNVKLNFYTRVGQAEVDLPVVRQIFRGASEQFLQIYVGGTLQNPEIRREAFPAVNQALQQLHNARQE
jgi:hypothetical protein